MFKNPEGIIPLSELVTLRGKRRDEGAREASVLIFRWVRGVVWQRRGGGGVGGAVGDEGLGLGFFLWVL